MTEPGFREIQLNTKQVVFLFMACIVAAVAVFLLGVYVGRGVGAEQGQTAADAAPATSPTPEVIAPAPSTPGTTPPQAGELTYHETLQGKPSATPPPPMPDAPPEATPAAPTPAAKAAPTTPAAKGTLYVQVDSFGSRSNAERRVAELKAKGFANAFLFEAPGPGARFKVRVGPLADRAAQDAMIAKLRKEGYKPSRIP